MSQNLLEQEHRAAQMKEPLEQCGRPLPAEAQPAAVLHPTDGALETLTALVVGYGGGQGVDRLLFTYDAENRLTGVSPATPQPGNARVLYTYDYLGRRVRKVSQERQSDGSWLTVADRLFIYDGWRLLCEQGTYQGNAFRRRYTWGLDLSRTLAGAGGIGGLLAVSDGPATPADYVYCYDGNGNVGQVLDLAPTTWNASAVMVARYEYDPYGRVLSQLGTFADPASNGNPFQFSTKYYDHEVGLIYFGYRYYSPRLGRWINRDPIGERGGRNIYGYLGNSPPTAVDPFGLWRIRRMGHDQATAISDDGDTIESLANIIGLQTNEWREWIAFRYLVFYGGYIESPSQKHPRFSSSTRLCANNQVSIPNSVLAHWGGVLGGFGKFWVMWDADVQTLRARGFRVHEWEYLNASYFEHVISSYQAAKKAHGVFAWGHGNTGLLSLSDSGANGANPGAYISYYRNWHPKYHMALGVVFACYSDSARSHFARNGAPPAIFWGSPGVLVPHGFHLFGPSLSKLIPPGAQGTRS
jgi:RHS repeat-associated protein